MQGPDIIRGVFRPNPFMMLFDLQENLPQWKKEDGSCDGLTTNGVLLMHQKGEWNAAMKPGAWREVSVFGDVYSLRKTRSAKEKGQFVSAFQRFYCYGTSTLCFMRRSS